MTPPIEKVVREIRINPIVPSESVLVATARGMRPKKAEEPAPRDARAHGQVIAMPIIPDNVQAEVTNSRAFHRKNHRCIFCSLIDEALTFEATIYDRDLLEALGYFGESSGIVLMIASKSSERMAATAHSHRPSSHRPLMPAFS